MNDRLDSVSSSPPPDASAARPPVEIERSWLAAFGRVLAVAAVKVDGRQLLTTGGDDGTVRLWDPTDRTQVGDPLTGHTSAVQAVAAIDVDGRQLLATGSSDSTVRLWDPTDRTPTGDAHSQPVT